MMIVKGSVRKYMGSFVVEDDAARQYDKYAIALWGNQARLNFDYSKREILELLKDEKEKTKKRPQSTLDLPPA